MPVSRRSFVATVGATLGAGATGLLSAPLVLVRLVLRGGLGGALALARLALQLLQPQLLCRGIGLLLGHPPDITASAGLEAVRDGSRDCRGERPGRHARDRAGDVLELGLPAVASYGGVDTDGYRLG